MNVLPKDFKLILPLRTPDLDCLDLRVGDLLEYQGWLFRIRERQLRNAAAVELFYIADLPETGPTTSEIGNTPCLWWRKTPRGI
jgi:hypothetical protein